MTKNEALKRAIKYLEGIKETEEYFNLMPMDNLINTINACKEALNIANCDLKQPSQEPVAWMDEANNTITTVQLMKYGWLGSDDRAIPDAWIKLYTHPHQWQGLTDDEIQNITWKIWGADALEPELDYAHAIEQALKEKNT